MPADPNSATPYSPAAWEAANPHLGRGGRQEKSDAVRDSDMDDAVAASKGGGTVGEGREGKPEAPEVPPGLARNAVPHEHRFFVHPFLSIVVCSCNIGKAFGDHFSNAGNNGDMTAVEARASLSSTTHAGPLPAAPAADNRDSYQLRAENKRLRAERQTARDEAAAAKRRVGVLEGQIEELKGRYDEMRNEVESVSDVRDHLRADASLMAYECEARRAAEEAMANAAARRMLPPATVRGHITGREYETMKLELAPCLDDFLKAKIR
ncbi:hypothetical protein HDZ31DRAFT_44597, partial [Schizophyllum fasciatum]